MVDFQNLTVDDYVQLVTQLDQDDTVEYSNQSITTLVMLKHSTQFKVKKYNEAIEKLVTSNLEM